MNTPIQQRSDNPVFRPRKPFVQRYFLVLMVALAFWLVIGRAIVGSAGWMILILLMTVAPVLVVYGITITIISMAKYRRSGFVFDARTTLVANGLVAALFIWGFTLLDAGDSKNSLSSGLIFIGESVTGVRDNATLVSVSSTIANISFVVSFLLMIMLFLAVVTKGARKKV